MMPAQWLLEETTQWLQHARRDLRAAELCVEELPAEALYHCQQAAEKAFKALLTFHQVPFRKTHELPELAAACILIDPSLDSEIRTPAVKLTRYSWLFRYPGAPYEPDVEEAVEGRAHAIAVESAISRRLPSA